MRSLNLRPRSLRAAGLTLILLALTLAATNPAAATTRTWSNADGGNWSDAANWSPAGVPAAGDVAVLATLGSPYVVALDANAAADEIQLQGGATLALGAHSLGAALVYNHGTIDGFHGFYDGGKLHNLAGGTVTTADYDSIVVGDTLTNDGLIVVGPQRENALFMVGSSRIEGSGSIRLEGSARINCPIERPQREINLTIGADQTLTGAGDVWVPVKNEGHIRQDSIGGAELILHTYLYNYGTIRVQDGGWINVDCPSMWQYDAARIEGSGGTFTLNVGPYGNMGSIDMLHGGTLVADGGDLSITALGIFGGTVERTGDTGAVAIGYYSDTQNLVVTHGAELRVDGLMDIGADGSTLENHGTVRVKGTLNILGPSGINISFSGDGQVVMDGGTLGTPAGALLTNAAGHTITGCGFIDANIDNYGVISVDCGSSSLTFRNGLLTNRNRLAILRGNLVLHGDRVANRGTIDASAGTIKLEAGATLENQAGAKPVLAGPGHFWIGWKTPASSVIGGTLKAVDGGDFTNVGLAVLKDVRLESGSTFKTIAGATTRASGTRFDLLGTNQVTGTGQFVVDPGTEYNQSTGATVLDGGTLTVPGGFAVQGVLSGHGTVIGNVTNDGEVSPTIAVDALKIQGNYAQSQVGHITLDLAGAATGQFARLAVTGSATLAGAAHVTSSAGFAPAPGQGFAVLTSASRSGEFAALSADPGLTLSAVYGNAGVTLESQSTVGVTEPSALPRTLRLAPRGMGFVLELPEPADVSVRVYDVRGREVAALAQGAKPAGYHALDLAKAAPGLGNGVYFARATVTGAAGSETRTARIVFLR